MCKMWIAWLLKILSPHLQYVFPMLLLTFRERWVKVLFLLYYVMLIYDSVQSSVLGLFTAVFEKSGEFKYLWNVDKNMFAVLLGASVFLHVIQVLFMVKLLFKINQVTETAATTSPRTGAAAEPENQPTTVSVAPRQKKKYTRKSPRSVQGEDEPGPSREQEEAEPVIVTRSLSLSEL